MCDMTKLTNDVEDLVNTKLSACEPFTTADISHPLITADPDIRHYQVRRIINAMDRRGEMASADFTTSNITVYPKGPNKAGALARLWHPIGYDPAEYTSNAQVLVRGGPTIDADDPPVDNAFVLAQPKKGDISVAYPCKKQKNDARTNIPIKAVRLAGFKPNDKLRVAVGNRGECRIVIDKTSGPSYSQVVDKEGRVRLYGEQAISGTAYVYNLGNGNKVIKVI